MDKYERSKQYHCTLETLKATLDQYGVAVLPRVLDHAKAAKLADGLWEYLEHISQSWEKPLSRSDPTTWKQIYDLMPSHSMLMQHFGIGHSQAVWDVRQDPAVLEVYAKLWNCEPKELLASFDGASIGMPPETTKRGWQDDTRYWLHTDQSYRRNKVECYQSWVTAHDVNKGDATLVVLEGSHLLHKEFAETFFQGTKPPAKDWYQLKTADEVSFYRERCSEVRIQCPAGSMVLWDSRTIHQGGQPLKGRPEARERAIVYLCYQPRNHLPSGTKAKDKTKAKAIEKKRRVFEARRMTSHWPLKSTLFPTKPQHYGKGLPEITPVPDPVLTSLGKSLAGFD